MERTVTMQTQPPDRLTAEEARRESIAEELRAAIRRKLAPSRPRSAGGAR